jgi:hypothetical protein
VNAYKFLASGARGPISGFAWPTPRGGAPGEWVEAEGALTMCDRGAHLCRPVDLSYWIHDELWEVETEGESIAGIDCLIARRARLVRRIEAWDGDGAARFGEAAAKHAADQVGQAPPDLRVTVEGYVEDAFESVRHGYVASCAYSAAIAVAKLDPPHAEARFRHERTWQADVIAKIAAARQISRSGL